MCSTLGSLCLLSTEYFLWECFKSLQPALSLPYKIITFQFNPALEKDGSIQDTSAPNAINVNELLQENDPPFYFLR